MRIALRPFALGAVLAVTACLGACGNPRETALPETGATLEGTVKYGKDDVQFALIIIQTAKGGTTASIKDGKYKVENVPLGEVQVGVNTTAGQGDYHTAVMGGQYKGLDAKGKGKTTIKFIDVPAKFAEPQTSGLKTTIEKGANTYNIEIPR